MSRGPAPKRSVPCTTVVLTVTEIVNDWQMADKRYLVNEAMLSTTDTELSDKTTCYFLFLK